MPHEQRKPRTIGVPSERDPASLRRDTFWAPQTIEQIAAEQGVSFPQNIDELVGQGADLWDSDDDFERFLATVTAQPAHFGR